jgi:hypothetical protein
VFEQRPLGRPSIRRGGLIIVKGNATKRDAARTCRRVTCLTTSWFIPVTLVPDILHDSQIVEILEFCDRKLGRLLQPGSLSAPGVFSAISFASKQETVPDQIYPAPPIDFVPPPLRGSCCTYFPSCISITPGGRCKAATSEPLPRYT